MWWWSSLFFPGAIAILRSQRVSGILGRNEISSQVINWAIVPLFKEFFFRCHCSIEVSKAYQEPRGEIEINYCTFPERVLLRVSFNEKTFLAVQWINKLYLSARAHSWEAAWNVIVSLLLNFNTYIFTSSWDHHWASRTRWRASSRGGKRQVFVIKLGFSRGGSDAPLWET